jgi:CHAT domain-containing protein
MSVFFHVLVCSMYPQYFRSLLLVPCLFILQGPGNRSATPAGMDAVEELTWRLHATQGSGPRISVLTNYRSCKDSVSSVDLIPQVRCGATGLSDRSLHRLASHVFKNNAPDAGSDVLHAGALLDLLSDDSAKVDRAISSLDSASATAHHAAPVLADLAAAHLLRAQQRQTFRDLVMAVNAAERGVKSEPTNRPALFNLALGLHWLGLESEARTAWRQFLSVDSTSAWADEARTYINRSFQPHAALSIPDFNLGAGPTDMQVATYAAAPGEAIAYGWDLLGGWGTRFFTVNDLPRPALLRKAGILGLALKQHSGDETLWEAVREIANQSFDTGRLRALGDAHTTYAWGRRLVNQGDNERAKRLFSHLHTSQHGSKILQQWAAISLAELLISQDSAENARQLLQQLALETDTIRHPYTAATVEFSLGAALMSTGQYNLAVPSFNKALRYLNRIGHRRGMGRVQFFLSKAEAALGNPDSAYEWVHRSLVNLQGHHQPRADVLYLATQLAMDDGLTYAAVHIQNEGLEPTRGKKEAEARLLRARALSASGKYEDAVQDVQRAQWYFEAFGTGVERRTFEAEVLLVEADAVLRDQPRRAIRLVDSVMRVATEPDHLAAALTVRSEAQIAVGEFDRAATDLHRAAALMEEQPASRKVLENRLHAVYRKLLMGYVNAGKSVNALELVELVRARETQGNDLQATRSLLTRTTGQSQSIIEYLVIGDTLLTWTLARGGIRLARSTISPHQRSLIPRARLALEFRVSDDVLLPHLQALHDWLIRPVQARIGTPGTELTIITDGELEGVPFSALYDARRGRYLIEDHPLRFARSLEGAYRNRDGAAAHETAMLVVADPEFDRRAHPDLGRLPEARLEADSIASEYPNADLVTGDQAGQSAVETRLRRATSLHFAGHAFYNEVDPAQSTLVLAPSGGRARDDGLTAWEIERLDLRHVRLVVLAACETLRSKGEWPQDAQGLAPAMLNAGVGGVVGSRWKVSDDLTRPLMVRFHRVYRASGDGAASLRAAQLTALRSRNPKYRSPAAWAAFEYMEN